MRHFLDIDQIDGGHLRAIIDQAHQIKKRRRGQPRGAPDTDAALAGRIVALVFEKPSTRTRVSFDVGVRQLGGQSLILSGSELHLGRSESAGDTASVLSRFVDLIMIRTFAAEQLHAFARAASVPVINGLTDHSHPCQIMADIMTFEEHRGDIAGKRVVWVGDGNNVCTSFIHAVPAFGFDLTLAIPQQLMPDSDLLHAARQRGARINTLDLATPAQLKQAVAGADLLVTDAWLSMHDAAAETTAGADRMRALKPCRIDDEVMAAAGPQALFMHCLPAHRGEEVTSSVMDGQQSVVFDEAENRLHVQKAILRWCLEI